MNVEMDTVGSTAGSCHDSNPIFEASDMVLGNLGNGNINSNHNLNNDDDDNTNNGNNNTNVSNDSSTKTKRRAIMRMRRQRRSPRKHGSADGRFGGRRQRRNWQLPKSSIDEYVKWIQEKPEEDRTPNEQRFLWKSMIRSLGIVNLGGPTDRNGIRSRQKRIREFVDRLEAKEPVELTEDEEQFLRLFYKRRKDRKAVRQRKQQHQEEEQSVSWMRIEGDNNNCGSGNNENIYGNSKCDRKSKTKNNKNNKGFEPQASLESLRESMNKLGLSSDKLKQVRFADQPVG